MRLENFRQRFTLLRVYFETSANFFISGEDLGGKDVEDVESFVKPLKA